MGYISNEKIGIIGNFAPISKKKPKNHDLDYKVWVPYSFKWRTKIGKVECSCQKVLECFMPYYGWNWYHEEACALMQRVKNRPQLLNLPAYSILPLLAQTE